MIPSHNASRIRGSHEAGIWKRWTQLANQTKDTDDGQEGEVSAAKMDGNNVVIFLLRMYGLLVPFTIILVKCRQIIGYYALIWIHKWAWLVSCNYNSEG